MVPTQRSKSLGVDCRTVWLVYATASISARWMLPPRSLLEAGPVALRDALVTIAFWLTVVGIAYGLGRGLLRYLALPNLSDLERGILSVSLGFGLMGSLVFVLGMIHFLNVPAILAILMSGAFLASREITWDLDRFKSWTGSIAAVWRSWNVIWKVVLLLSILIAGLSLVFSLTPPWDCDGLMYHLVGPRLWLDAGGIDPHPDNWYLDSPSLVEMIFTLGMAFGDDLFPKLVHFTMACLFLLASYGFARRWLGSEGAWLTLAVLMGIPVLPILASFAYIDFGWALFEFLGLGCAFLWRSTGNPRLLIAGGMLMGLGASSKYLGIVGMALVGLYVLVSMREFPLGVVTQAGLAYAGPAVLVASGWYLRNWMWFGNPVYPLYFGGTGFDLARLELHSAYIRSYGAGNTFVDFLLLPVRVYTEHTRFGSVMNRIDFPSLLFPLALSYPFLPRSRILSPLLVISLLRVAIWALTSQQLRFLLPVYPIFAMAAAYGIIHGSHYLGKVRKGWQHFLPTLALGLMLPTLFYSGVMWYKFQPQKPIVGVENRQSFLLRIVKDYYAVRYLNEALEPNARAILLGNGRGYYCLPKCIPDPDHFRWAAEIARRADSASLESWFLQQGADYLIISWEDIDFLLQHDPEHVVRRSLDRLQAFSDAGCLREVTRDEWSSVYQVDCASP